VNRHNTSEKPRGRFRRLGRWFLRSLLILVALLAAGSLYLAVNHWRAVNRLAEATAEQDANHPGWRIEDIEAARAVVPDDENGILVVLATAKLLPKDWPPRDVPFPKPDAESPPNRRLDKGRLDRLRAELEAVNAARAEARRLVKYPTGRYALVYQRDPLSTLLPHAQEARQVTCLLALDAVLHAEDGDFPEAAVLCRAALNAGRSLGDEPISISQLIRLTCVTIAGQAIERLLAQGELGEADLTALQAAVEEEARHPGLLVAYRGWRAVAHRTFQVLQDGEFVVDIYGDRVLRPATWSERWYTLHHRDALRLQEVEAFPMLNRLVEIAETPAHLRARPLQEFRAMVQSAKERVNAEAVLLLGGMDRHEAAFTRCDAYLACLAAALAAERHRRARGEWPPSLEALAPQFLGALPLDPADGQPVRYAKRDDGAVVYSGTADGKGQVFDPDGPLTPGEGIAVRLWDPDRRGKSD
jgi:hypothetical protein